MAVRLRFFPTQRLVQPFAIVFCFAYRPQGLSGQSHLQLPFRLFLGASAQGERSHVVSGDPTIGMPEALTACSIRVIAATKNPSSPVTLGRSVRALEARGHFFDRRCNGAARSVIDSAQRVDRRRNRIFRRDDHRWDNRWRCHLRFVGSYRTRRHQRLSALRQRHRSWRSQWRNLCQYANAENREFGFRRHFSQSPCPRRWLLFRRQIAPDDRTAGVSAVVIAV